MTAQAKESSERAGVDAVKHAADQLSEAAKAMNNIAIALQETAENIVTKMPLDNLEKIEGNLLSFKCLSLISL